MADNREEIVRFVRVHGPLLPAQLAKEINTNILFASALLGELVSLKKLKYTRVKSGSSPFYYVSGQESRLQVLAQFLKGKEKEAHDLLKEEWVMRDTAIEPWQRVALRELKDFAVPLEVDIQGKVELFWKWYMLDNERVKAKIATLLGIEQKTERELVESVKEDVTSVVSAPTVIVPSVEKPVERKKIELEPPKPKVEPELPKPKTVKLLVGSAFYNRIHEFTKKENLSIIEETMIKKSKEYTFTVRVPSKIGELSYLLIAKAKKTLNESDLILAVHEGTLKKMPVLLVAPGSLNKKAEAYLKRHIGNMLVFKKI